MSKHENEALGWRSGSGAHLILTHPFPNQLSLLLLTCLLLACAPIALGSSHVIEFRAYGSDPLVVGTYELSYFRGTGPYVSRLNVKEGRTLLESWAPDMTQQLRKIFEVA